ncbi:MAG: GNAT family N-acetyltransferase [Phycisphaeraceae bacterium]|nr:GNAT family N-acetyltransferase [Phycisphaeraceae bacterium]
MSAPLPQLPQVLICMYADDLAKTPRYELPPSYTFRSYREGDRDHWVRIWKAAEKSDTITPQLFDHEYGLDQQVLSQRMLFLLDPAGQPIGTSTAWFDNDYHGKSIGRVHWIAILPECQGLGLAKPLLAATCQRLSELGHKDVYLWTHSHRLPALNLYLNFGFIPDIKDHNQAAAWALSLQSLKRISPVIRRYDITKPPPPPEVPPQPAQGQPAGASAAAQPPAVPTPQAPKPPPTCSPSFVHQQIMKRTRPTLTFKGKNVRAWQSSLRRKLHDLMGMNQMPKPAKTPKVQSLWKRQHPLGTIEKLLITVEPGADMPAYLCLPKNAQPPYLPFICLQGHAPGFFFSIAVDPRDEVTGIPIEGDRDFALGCMSRGIAALCLEQRCFGERRELLQAARFEHNTCHDAVMRALMLGRTMIGERVYDVDRAIDYLASRPDMDLARLGVMGNSGGGTISTFAAALLPRVRFAMPSCYFCTFADSIMSIYHCADNYIPSLYLHAEMYDVLGLFAPRPVVVVAGQTDPIFPIAGVHKAFAALKKIYRAAGAPDNCKLVVGPEGHQFYAAPAWAEMMPLLNSPPGAVSLNEPRKSVGRPRVSRSKTAGKKSSKKTTTRPRK